jgi:hypothetical protein
MKTKNFLISISAAFYLIACQATLSETALQTAVSEAIMTSSAPENEVAVTAMDTELQTEFDNAKAQLRDAHLQLTDQAENILALQEELDQVYPLLTPSNTPPLPTATNTPLATATFIPSPTSTQTDGLLFNQKYVVAISGTPVFTYEDENDTGYPIMTKVKPVKRFESGEKFIVNIYPIRADGGGSFYEVIGPKLSGYFVRVEDVQDSSG